MSREGNVREARDVWAIKRLKRQLSASQPAPMMLTTSEELSMFNWVRHAIADRDFYVTQITNCWARVLEACSINIPLISITSLSSDSRE